MGATIKLSKREEQIAELLAWGAAKKEVPDLLPVKPGRGPIAIQTVENTVRNIYEKLGIQKVNELSAWYFVTHFSIPASLSPLKRKIISAALLLIILLSEISNLGSFVRPSNARAKVARSYSSRSRRRDESTFELI